MPLRSLDGIAHFPIALPVRADASDLVVEAVIGGVAATLALPGLKGAMVAPARIAGRDVPEILDKTVDDGWGYRASTSGLYYISYAAISFQLEDLGNLIGSPVLRAFGEAFQAWFEIVSDWATVLSGMLVKDFDKRSQDTLISVALESNRYTGTGGVRTIYVFAGSGMSAAQVREAFRHASEGEELPAEHKFLHASWGARIVNDSRRAVIEAGTASEVALASAITKRLAATGVSEDFVQKAIVNANGIAGLVSLYGSLGGELAVSRNKVGDQLASTRNRAAHAGYVPTREETDRAYEIARSIVLEVCPLTGE
jgi:hypothetical protein